MTRKEKAVLDVEAIENGKENYMSGQALSLLNNQYITNNIESQSIAKHLHRGAENAISTARAKALGLLAAIVQAYRELRRLDAFTPQETGQLCFDDLEEEGCDPE